MTARRVLTLNAGSSSVEASDHRSAAHALIDWLEKEFDFDEIEAAGRASRAPEVRPHPRRGHARYP
jgi:hypothetical protein